MTSKETREAFLDFFRSKNHHIVPSAPMVIKNDPSLMFTNAGMNQFKDIFLGNSPPPYNRIANSQKCLRVSGKHNDLEEVGHDTYHHTMFEMLGNWSFGDYFKKEAVTWAYEFLVKKVNIPSDRLYATVFKGDKKDHLDWDEETYRHWLEHIAADRILKGSKKDNFWEMGDTGPCGPCSEIHVDLRDDDERNKIPGKKLVNKNHHKVLEIWNLVFIQFNRKANGQLEPLPNKHIDTGLGLERLCMALQNKSSNYDTDLFYPVLEEIGRITGKSYGAGKETDMAMRVVADHLRAVAFAITDGQIPSNNKAGYVIRRILRRAVRYGYTFLEQTNPFMYKLLPVLTEAIGDAYPELQTQQTLIKKVIFEEENSFLRTLDTGITMLDQIMVDAKKKGIKKIGGKSAFILYDTYGFPFDLTQLILREKGLEVNHKEFETEMQQQRTRSKDAAHIDKDDWIELESSEGSQFIGFDNLNAEVKITRFRRIEQKGKEFYHLVLNKTPFYAESGGQVGDHGYLVDGNERTRILDTQKENELIIHTVETLPANPSAEFTAIVNKNERENTACHHTSTHLLHYALRKILGNHVEQKGSLVHPEYLRFDFSHFQKVSDNELHQIESLVNELIRSNIPVDEKKSVPIDQAMKMGALAFFGEKYGEKVRIIRFGDSIELCGGTHVQSTGEIGFFKIIRESAIAAGIRRIEAKASKSAEDYINHQLNLSRKLEKVLKTHDTVGMTEKMMAENTTLKKQIEELQNDIRAVSRKNLLEKIRKINNINVIAEEIQLKSGENIRTLVFELRKTVDNLFLIVGANLNGKAHLSIMISDNIVNEHNLDANKMIMEIASEIDGGGGGQSFYATAGGKKPAGISKAIEKALGIITRTTCPDQSS